MPKIVKLQKL